MRFSVLVCVLASLMFAADPTGSITRKSGGSFRCRQLQERSLRVDSQGTGLTREATSASDGGFLFPLLPPGDV